MSDQLLSGLTSQQDTWDDVEHDRTGGPSYGVPLQDQVESTEAHNRLLEDALTKCTDVIAALMGERKDLTEQVYQAQVDAQDWQNKYTQAHKDWEKGSALSEDYFQRMTSQADTIREMLGTQDALNQKYTDHTDGYKDDIGRLEGLLYDEKQKNAASAFEAGEGAGTLMARILELQDQLLEFEALRTRVFQLTHDNTQLELCNERQAERLGRVQKVIRGDWDNRTVFLGPNFTEE